MTIDNNDHLEVDKLRIRGIVEACELHPGCMCFMQGGARGNVK